jgi:NitT/TauT family transport system substrate-binding protein
MTARLSRRRLLTAASLLLATTAHASANGAAPMTLLDVAAPLADDTTPLLYAAAAGLARRRDLEITIQRAASGAAIAAGVMGGTYALGGANCVTMITAHSKGLPFVYVAPAGIYNAAAPVTALLVRSDSNIHTAADLNGKTLASSSVIDLYTLSARNWMDQHGGDSSSLKILELPPSALAAAFTAGRIDAAGIVEPALSSTLASGKVRVLAHMHDAIAPRFLISGWFTTLDYATKNRDVVDRFRSALYDGAIYANAHHDATVSLLAQWTGMDPGVLAGATRATYGLTLDPRLIQPVIDLCVKYRTISAGFDARELLDLAISRRA